MRCTTVRGLNDTLHIDLGSDVGLIAFVMENGRSSDALIYELTLDGEGLLAVLENFGLNKKFGDMIIPENTYVITAYDW